MIDYVKRNDIFGDFRRNLSNREIVRKHGISRTTVVGLRKLYNATVADQKNPEALAEMLQSKPKYKDSEAVSPALTDEIRRLIDKDLTDTTGLKKQRKRATDIHSGIVKAGYDISYRTVVRYISDRKKSKFASASDCYIKQKYVPGECLSIDDKFVVEPGDSLLWAATDSASGEPVGFTVR